MRQNMQKLFLKCWVLISMSVMVFPLLVAAQSPQTLNVVHSSYNTIPINLEANHKMTVNITSTKIPCYVMLFYKSDYDAWVDVHKDTWIVHKEQALENTIEWEVTEDTALVVLVGNPSGSIDTSVDYTVVIEEFTPIPWNLILYGAIGASVIIVVGVLVYRRKKWEGGLTDNI